MEKELQQEQELELDQVSGGKGLDMGGAIRWCPSCNARHYGGVNYPSGFRLKTERHGCGNTTWYYKCPDCGYTWSE